MSNLITVSQHDDYKIYVYSDKPIPTSNLETICLGKNPSDIKAVIYIFKPNLFNTNGYNIGVIGKTDDMCNNDNFRKWESIEWKNDGVSFGNGEYFFSKQSFPSLK